MPHATHPFGVRAAGLSHFAPFGDAVACGQLAIVKVSEVSSPSKIEGELPLGQKGRFFLSDFLGLFALLGIILSHSLVFRCLE